MLNTKPWNVQLELVFGCNRRCDFCATKMFPRTPEYMPFEVLCGALNQLRAFDPLRVELAMRGEPTLHPELRRFIHAIRAFMPLSQLTLTTNGHRLLEKNGRGFDGETLLYELYEGGLNIVVWDCYTDTMMNDARVYLQRVFDRYGKFATVYDFYADGFNPWHRHDNSTRAIVLVQSLGQANGQRAQRVVLNQAGNVDWEKVARYGVYPLSQPLECKCVHPFREIAIFHNGDVPLCCRDWCKRTIMYNVYTEEGFRGKQVSLQEYWRNDPRLEAARKLLYNKRRNFGICKGCDFRGGFRLGFLPKSYGVSEIVLASSRMYWENLGEEGANEPWQG